MRGVQGLRAGEHIAFREAAQTAQEVLRLRRVLALGELGQVLENEHGRGKRRRSSKACQGLRRAERGVVCVFFFFKASTALTS